MGVRSHRLGEVPKGIRTQTTVCNAGSNPVETTKRREIFSFFMPIKIRLFYFYIYLKNFKTFIKNLYKNNN